MIGVPASLRDGALRHPAVRKMRQNSSLPTLCGGGSSLRRGRRYGHATYGDGDGVYDVQAFASSLTALLIAVVSGSVLPSKMDLL